jgi:glycerophosphoryl diester phosphodiesterase
MRRILLWTAGGFGLFAVVVYFANSPFLAAPREGRPLLLAHRGLAQTFPHAGLAADTCTAGRIDPPEHPYIENSLPSIEAAFRYGADIVEFDVHPTSDGAFAVFHDWAVDCRTNGRGATREHSLAALKALDIGYGYTADGGRTHPFRGKGVGLLPSLDEVLDAFPDRRFLIHVKGNTVREGEMLAARLAELPPRRRQRLLVYGGDRPIRVLRQRFAEVPAMGKRAMLDCLIRYLSLGWAGHVPAACRRSILLVPVNYAPLLWGWPDLFIERMERVGTTVFAVGPWEGEDFSRGIDSLEALRELPGGFSGGVWTNRIDRLGPAVRGGG